MLNSEIHMCHTDKETCSSPLEPLEIPATLNLDLMMSPRRYLYGSEAITRSLRQIMGVKMKLVLFLLLCTTNSLGLRPYYDILCQYCDQLAHLKTIPEKFIVSDFHFFRIPIVQFILGCYFTLTFVGWRRNIGQPLQLNAARDQGLSAETCCAEREIYIELSLFV